MKNSKHSRRTFLRSSGAAVGGSWLAMNMPLVLATAQTACSRREEGASWASLTDVEARGLAAVAEQVPRRADNFISS